MPCFNSIRSQWNFALHIFFCKCSAELIPGHFCCDLRAKSFAKLRTMLLHVSSRSHFRAIIEILLRNEVSRSPRVGTPTHANQVFAIRRRRLTWLCTPLKAEGSEWGVTYSCYLCITLMLARWKWTHWHECADNAALENHTRDIGVLISRVWNNGDVLSSCSGLRGSREVHALITSFYVPTMNVTLFFLFFVFHWSGSTLTWRLWRCGVVQRIYQWRMYRCCWTDKTSVTFFVFFL